MGFVHPNNGDRSIYYPNDPFPPLTTRKCTVSRKGQCVQRSVVDLSERMKTAVQFPDLSSVINENYKDNRRVMVHMNQYRQWL